MGTPSSCVAKLAPGVAAYNSAMGSTRLCEAIRAAGIDMPCPLETADINALDRKVLCAIFCCCKESPNINSAGARRYQSCVAATLRAAQAGETNAPAYRMNPEVSYNMNTNPPTPVGRFFDSEALKFATKAEYETATGRRRPDVVVRRGNGGLSGNNIQRVYEMKFPGDQMGDGQLDAYENIAGGPKNLEELNDRKCCNGQEEKQGERLLEASRQAQAAARGDFLSKLAALALTHPAGRLLGAAGGVIGSLARGAAVIAP